MQNKNKPAAAYFRYGPITSKAVNKPVLPLNGFQPFASKQQALSVFNDRRYVLMEEEENIMIKINVLQAFPKLSLYY